MSTDLKMAIRNLWRNPRRTLLTLSAIAFACLLLVFMLSFQLGSYGTMINAAVRIETGHLQVQAQEYQEKRGIRQTVDHPEIIGEVLENVEAIQAYTFRAQAFSFVSSEERSYGALVVGIDPVREAQVSTLPHLIRKGSYLEKGDMDQALVGKLLAQNLKVDIGDELVVLGQGMDGSVAATVLRVKGIYSSGQDEFDRSAIQMPLSYFQEVYFLRGAVHQVIGVCPRLGRVSEAKAAVQKRLHQRLPEQNLVVLDWNELMPGLMQAIKLDLTGGLIFWGILIIVVAFSILNTFLMAVLERTREFGVLMAIGAGPGRLMRLLLAESVFMTLIGVISGILLGCLVTLFFQSRGIDMGGASELLQQFGISGRMYPRLSWISALLGPALVFIITLLAAIYPAMKIRRLNPVEAMNQA